ncbi:MAG: hypothetical protein ABIC82_00270 [bacterium]
MNDTKNTAKPNPSKLMFFVSCPKCKKKFGIEPKYIFLYIKRIVASFGEKFSGVGDMLSAAQDSIKKRKE